MSKQDDRRASFVPDELLAAGKLKFELLAEGIRISPEAHIFLSSAKRPMRTRSGAAGGLDVVLPHEIHVNCPVDERFAANSTLVLDVVDEELCIKRDGTIVSPAKLQPKPAYYGRKTSDGKPMEIIGQMCSGDRFCYGMTGPYCFFWRRERRCQYCSIGLNKARDASRKSLEQLLESLEAAILDPALPAKHVLVGGGTPDGEDMGAVMASTICQAIKEKHDVSCYVMIAAPLADKYIDMLHEAGADELGMNLEFYGDAAWREYIPGKNDFIGKTRYLKALEHSVSRFGPINTRSLLIVGLEPPEATIAGAEYLASMGVMPILSPFRPLDGTILEDRRGFDSATYWDLYLEVHERCMKYGIPTGPTCIACQNNILALPLPEGGYRQY